MQKFLKELGIYIVVAVALFTCFIWFQPKLTQSLPNDYSRHHAITDALYHTKGKPEFIIFGDSRTMFGVDAKAISKQLPGELPGYNLSSVGQSYFESCYFISALPSSVHHVIHFIGSNTFREGRTDFNDDKSISMLMNGYKIDDTTKQLLQKVNQPFNDSYIKNAFEGRIAVKSAMHVQLRKVLDNEVFADCYNDIYFPHIYTKDKHPQYPFYKIPCDLDTITYSKYTIGLANRVTRYLANRKIQYHLVVLPVNPDLCMPDSAAAEKNLATLQQLIPGVHIINFSRALNNQQFYDAEHPNKKGAAIVSKLVGDSLALWIRLNNK